AVHEEALAAADRPPQVDPARQRRLDDQALEGARAPRLVGAPFFEELLQPLHRAPLRRVGHEAAPVELLPVKRDDILAHGSLAISSCAPRSTSLRSISGSSVVFSRVMRSSCIASQAIEPSRLSQIWKNRRRSADCVSTRRQPKKLKRPFVPSVKF